MNYDRSFKNFMETIPRTKRGERNYSNIRTKTIKAFHSAQLFLVQKDKFTDLKVHIYPEIRNIKLMNHAEIVFTIPRGMNPEDITKKEYVFKQYLSDRAELEVGTLKSVIRIFPDEIQNVFYDYDAFPIK